MLDLPFLHNDHVLFHNSATAETCSGSGDDGFVQFNNERANAYVVEFTSPVSGIYAMQSSGSSYSGAWRLIKFVGTSGSTEMKIVHQSATSAGTLYKFKCPNDQDVLVRTGDVCLFWNDGTDWVLVSGGRPYPTTLTYLSASWALTQTIFLYKNFDSLVKIDGGVVYIGGYTAGVHNNIATLPVKYRPITDQYFTAINKLSSSDIGTITVKTNGEINLLIHGASGLPVQLGLSNISFYASEI